MLSIGISALPWSDPECPNDHGTGEMNEGVEMINEEHYSRSKFLRNIPVLSGGQRDLRRLADRNYFRYRIAGPCITP